jgi:hypothetical protein
MMKIVTQKMLVVQGLRGFIEVCGVFVASAESRPAFLQARGKSAFSPATV